MAPVPELTKTIVAAQPEAAAAAALAMAAAAPAPEAAEVEAPSKPSSKILAARLDALGLPPVKWQP